MSGWLEGTICDKRVRVLTPARKDRIRRKQRLQRRKNVIILAKRKGRTVGQALRALELKDRRKARLAREQ